MKRIRNDEFEWKEDGSLRKEIEEYIRSGYKRKEILSFLVRDYPIYAWSERSLDRRIEYFNLSRKYNQSTFEEANNAVSMELEGPGQLLGYRAMHQKLQKIHQIYVPRDVVYAIMGDLAPQRLEARRPCFKKKRVKGNFTSPGPNFVHSLDGHDKLMGFQNWTFPLAVYGCIDTCSRKVLWVKVWTNNSDPKYPGGWYLDYIKKKQIIAQNIRVDKGTETVELTAIYSYLVKKTLDIETAEATDTIMYGPSTSNQIERWWRELHERLEKYFKRPLLQLKDCGHYFPDEKLDRDIIAYLVIPIIQKEVDVFVSLWNTHRIRKQKGVQLPDGIPEHIYEFPSEYGLTECGLRVNDDLLSQVEQFANLKEIGEDYVDDDFRNTCDNILRRDITHSEIYDAFCFLKDRLKAL